MSHALSGVKLGRALCAALDLPIERIRKASIIGDASNVAVAVVEIILSTDDLRRVADELDKAAKDR